MYATDRPVYEGKATGKDRSKLIKAIAFPLAIFLLCIFAISTFKNFGKLLMTPLIGAIWIMGAACALYMPSHRKTIINETLVLLTSYNGTLLALRHLIAVTAGVSSEMLMATFGQTMPTAVGNTIPGMLQSMLYASSVLIPLGYFGMELKRIVSFRKNINKSKKLQQLRGIRGE